MKISLADVAPDLRKGFGLALEPNGDLVAWSGKPPEGAVDVVTTLLEVVRTELEWRAAEVREAAAREACRRAAATFVVSEAGNQAKAAYWAAMRGAFEAKSAHEAALAKVTL